MRLPRRFGPYVLLERLGEGGIGNVHLARPLDPHRGVPTPIVIKRLNYEPSKDPQLIRRFQHEAAIAVSVESSYLVKVFDVGAVDRQPYIAMEFVPGWMLARVYQALLDARRYAPIPAAVELIIGGLRGLEALHDAADRRTGEPLGAVHRDISPRNVMIDDHGCIRVIDLGLGKSNIQDWKTRAGMVLGSPGYMAPEQTRGDAVDHRADLYSMAAVLYETLVLEPYIARGDRIQMLRAMERPVYVPMIEHRANIPPALEEAVRRGLAVDPEERHPNARAFIDALENAVPVRDPHAFGRIVGELLGRELERTSARIRDLLYEDTHPDIEAGDSETVVYAVRSGVHTLDDREPPTLVDGEPDEDQPAEGTPSSRTIPLQPAARIAVRRGIPLNVVIVLISIAIAATLALDRFLLRPTPTIADVAPAKPSASLRPTAVAVDTDEEAKPKKRAARQKAITVR